MLEAKFDRVGIGRQRHLIHEALDREHIHVGAERAQRGNAHRHLRDEMARHFGAGKLVERDGITVAAAGRLRNRPRRGLRERLRHQPARHQIAGAFRPRRMRVAPDIVAEVDDIACASSVPRILDDIAGP